MAYFQSCILFHHPKVVFWVAFKPYLFPQPGLGLHCTSTDTCWETSQSRFKPQSGAKAAITLYCRFAWRVCGWWCPHRPEGGLESRLSSYWPHDTISEDSGITPTTDDINVSLKLDCPQKALWQILYGKLRMSPLCFCPRIWAHNAVRRWTLDR